MIFEVQNECDVFMCNYNVCIVFDTAFGIFMDEICSKFLRHSCKFTIFVYFLPNLLIIHDVLQCPKDQLTSDPGLL
jgi:hypothetical protein